MHNGPYDCFICRKHRGEVSIPGGAIYQDDLLYAGHAQLPEGKTTCYLGWIIVETKRHVPELADLTDAEAQALGLMVSRVSRALMASEQAEHVHVHVVPRYPGAPRQYWGTHVDEWPDAPHGGRQEMAALCARLRTHLEW